MSKLQPSFFKSWIRLNLDVRFCRFKNHACVYIMTFPGVTFMPLNQLSAKEVKYPKSSDALPMIDKLKFDEKFRGPVLQVSLFQVCICIFFTCVSCRCLVKRSSLVTSKLLPRLLGSTTWTLSLWTVKVVFGQLLSKEHPLFVFHFLTFSFAQGNKSTRRVLWPEGLSTPKHLDCSLFKNLRWLIFVPVALMVTF